MERRSFKVLFLTLLLGMFSLGWAVTPVYVDDDYDSSTVGWGTTHFATIANGITAVDAGGTVNVAAGSYASCGITKSVILLGANAGIHPAVGTHDTETVGVRVAESIWGGCNPAADNITIDGFHFLKAGTRMIDTYASANSFVLKNCIVESTTFGATTGVIQFGGGSHTDCIFEFNLFTDKGDHTFYAGGGPFDGLTFRYNKFQAEGDLFFWAASPLVDGVILGNEFDGENGANFNTVNIGQAGNIQITDNWVHDCLYTAFQVGIIGGAITDNLFERTYSYDTYGARAFELWGGQWGTAVSQNVTISGNTIYFNDIPGASYPSHGFRLRAPETGSGIDGSTIHFEDNSFINGDVLANAYALWFQGDQSTAVDAEYNYWDAANPNFSQIVSGNVDYDPWWKDSAMLIPSNAKVHNTMQDTWFTTIQAAIDDAVEYDVIEIEGGTYVEQLHITTDNLTLQGDDGRYPVVIKSPATLTASFPTPGNVNKPVVFVDGANNFTLEYVTVDGDYKGNANYRFIGIAFWNSDGVVQNVEVINIIDNPFSGSQHGVGIYAFNNTPSVEYAISLDHVNVTNFQKNAVSLIGEATTKNLTVNVDFVTVVGQGPTATTAQNGIQVQYASGTVDDCNISGIHYTGSGNWAASGILPYGAEDLVITGNSLTDCGYPIYPNLSNNITIQYNIIQAGPLGVGAQTAIAEYNTTNMIIDHNVITDAGYGMWISPATVTNNNISGAEYAIILDGGAGYTITGNTFADNYVHVYNFGTVPDMSSLPAINTFDNYLVVDQVVYGNVPGLVYVEAPNELIKDNEEQTYSVKVLNIEDLRGYTVQVKIPKLDFYQPTDFNIGSAFQNVVNYPDGYFFFPMASEDADYWIYDVTGAFQGGYNGIDGNQVALFTFKARSLLDRDNITIPGCWIEIPETMVVLKDDQNPYNSIPVEGTIDMFVLIDATEPTITIDNLVTYPDGMTLPIDPALTVANGYPSVAIPLLSLDYWDNYNLDLSRYMLVASGGTVPTTVAEFAAATYLFGAAYVGATNNNLIWNDPDADLNVALNNLPNGTYTLYFLAVDDAGNFIIEDWTFVIDKEATGPIVWDNTIPCRTTPNSNNSIDLKWANPVGAVNNHIWVLSYGDLGSGAGAYPEYNAAGFSVPAIPTAPNPYNPAVQNGWTKYPVIPAPLTFPYALTGMARGWYYITIFAEDASGNISEKPVNPFYRESISYWPGDVATPNGTVLGTDIAILSAAWGTHDGQTGFNNIVDVGPSTDYARRSRPTPDNVINIEDLMMFAMNYNNTVYTWYPRGDELPVFEPVSIALSCRAESDMLYVDILLDGNDSAIKGLDIPVQYGTGLSLQYVSLGEIWPEGSLLLHTDMDHIVGVTASALGYDSVIQSNGCVATLAFKINGNATDIELRHMTARTMDNREIVIEGNPNDITTGIDDPGIVVPPANFLGCNHPNPFNGSTAIEYGIKQASHVKLSVFNTRGQLIRTLVQDNKAPGSYQAIWNGKDNNNLSVSSGIYFFRMETNEGIKIIKGLLAK